jgi:hypothetical protein
MANKPAQSLTKHFGTMADPRTGNAKRHLLLDILVIAICAAICGANTWVEVELWAKANRKWLRTFLELLVASLPCWMRINSAVAFWCGFVPSAN